MLKKDLRKIYLEKRLALSPGDYGLLNRNLCDLFFSCVDLSFIRVLHLFLPIVSKREPDTWLILDRIRREFPHIQISVPKLNRSDLVLDNFNFEGLHQIRENAWGIPEPEKGIPTRVDKIDMVLVPLLAFDERGHRVGYGGGYYDRFLAQCRPDCITTGISFFAPLAIIDDVDMHDRKLDQVVTPDQFYQF